MAGKKKAKNQTGGAQGTLGNVTDYRHDEATRKNNPPAKIAAEGTVPVMGKIHYEYSPRLAPVLRFDSTGAPDALPELLEAAQRRALTAEETKLLAEALRNQEPWLEWASKREKRHFEVDPVALHIHERVSPQAILRVAARQDVERSLFADPEQSYNEAVQFYRHEVPWTNRLILGDSLQVMTSLARREDLAGKVQMIYMDPPYGIRFASNFQPEVGKREVSDKEKDLTRELETVKAYRDAWTLGTHSYLSYLKERLTVARGLLADAGSVFLQIGEENLHRVRSLLDEVFGPENFIAVIVATKTTGASMEFLDSVADYVLWYAKDRSVTKYRQLFLDKSESGIGFAAYRFAEFETGERRPIRANEREDGGPSEDFRLCRIDQLTSQTNATTTRYDLTFDGEVFKSGKRQWATPIHGMQRIIKAGRVAKVGTTPVYIRYLNDFLVSPLRNVWTDTSTGGFGDEKVYVVQTTSKLVLRCLLMTTDPGDLVLDPTCGSGTTAFVAEQWGRR
jgi:adenine-specific DNA-methyltransferase